MQNFDTDRNFLAQSFGIHMPLVQGIFDEGDIQREEAHLAMDAQPSLITQSNAGIPAYLTNYLDPKVLRVLTTPNKAAVIAGGEVKKGDWTDDTAQFPLIETVGEVSSYGDFSETGMSNANVNWEPRQSYLAQTITTWGERELDRYGRARISWASELNTSSAIILDKFMNNMYFFGVSGLQNFGLLNDPSLPASIAPLVGVGGNTWALKTAAEIYSDIQALFEQLITQTQGLVDRETPMVLAMSPQSEAQLTKTNMYNVNVSDQLKKNFPNLRVESAVQYGLGVGGNLVQMIAEELEGQRTVEMAFNEKMRAHPVVVGISNWKQKKTSGGWGAIIRMPVAIASMIGV